MNRIDLCLSQIEAIRDVEAGQVPPYVGRSRIGRLALSVARLLAHQADLFAPDLPGMIQVPPDAPKQVRDLALQCNRLSYLARHLAQPSEPLEDRWRRGWNELLVELGDLENQLRAVRRSSANE